MKECRLVHHCGCHCAEERWALDNGEREQWRWVELWWRGALAREEAKWRCCWVVKRVVKFEITFFIAVEGGCRIVRGGWSAVVVWIQYFSFSSRGEMTGQSVAKRWRGGSDLVLAPWEGSVRQRGDVGLRRYDTGEGKGRRQHHLGWRES
jgi:hypothetical protein